MREYTIRSLIYATTDSETRKQNDLKFISALNTRFLDYNDSVVGLLSKLEEQRKVVGVDKRSLPRPAVMAHNKLNEIYREFAKSGISLSASPLMHYLSQILLEQIAKANVALEEYADKAIEVTTKHNKQLMALLEENNRPLKKLFTKIKSFFGLQKPEPVPTIAQEDQEQLDTLLGAYEAINEEISNISIEKDLIPYVVTELCKYTVNDVIMNMYDIRQELMSLGYADYIPQMESTISQAFKDRLPSQDEQPIKDEDMYKYVPDFSRPLDMASAEELRALNEAFYGKKTDDQAIGQKNEEAPDVDDSGDVR